MSIGLTVFLVLVAVLTVGLIFLRWWLQRSDDDSRE